ncbi:unnamed protein product [Acanthoscelides obtectus]|uniref:Uncharacterized protein n=1 Tax=Acanthoscelides obtectus TaxID=200917 RepID=A0A9P0Q683_ACAOB|nr:unnamed protein product [Acanthoscelides obtectus]CAK1680404.1 hypothetical protein AOBTE_LOCUS32625 [Acanthoscelides obtectus]
MSSQRAKLILKLAKTKARVEKKENGAQDSWKISQHNNIGNTSSTAEEAVNSVTVNKESLNMIESNNIRNSLKEAKNATEDKNNIESVNQIDLPSQNVISQTTIIPGIIFDESSEDIGGVTLINRTRSQGLLRADEYEEFPSSNGPSSELIEEEATSSKVFSVEPAIQTDNNSSSRSSSDSDPTSSEEEPFGSGASEEDPDFEPENILSSSESEVDGIPQNVALPIRRSVHYPSETEKQTKKRKRVPDEWQKNKAKRLRNTGKSYESIRKIKKSDGSIERMKVKREERKMSAPCGKKCRLKCSTKISQDQRQKIFEEYWQLGDVLQQRGFIAGRMLTIKPKYRCQKGENSRRLNSSFFFDLDGQNIRICKQFFMSTLGISSRVIRTVTEKQDSMTKGILKQEIRGKHTNHYSISNGIKEDIRAHINSIPRIPSHYCRSQTKKEYIEGGKTVRDLYRDYKNICQEDNKPYANYLMYYTIFNQQFNIAFFTPKKDACELCLAYTNANQEEKTHMKNKYDTHLKEKELSRSEKQADKVSDKVVAVYDLQAILPCPIVFFQTNDMYCQNDFLELLFGLKDEYTCGNDLHNIDHDNNLPYVTRFVDSGNDDSDIDF